jgi:hypothetical protein
MVLHLVMGTRIGKLLLRPHRVCPVWTQEPLVHT